MKYDIWNYITEILHDRAQYYAKREKDDIVMAYETAITLIEYGEKDNWECVEQFDYFKEK